MLQYPVLYRTSGSYPRLWSSSPSQLWPLVFNVGNMLLTVGISLAGISIAMPVGTDLSLALGLVVNYISEPKGSVPLLAIGGAVILGAMIFSALAYQSKQSQAQSDKSSGGNRGIWIALTGGLVAGSFSGLFPNPWPKTCLTQSSVR